MNTKGLSEAIWRLLMFSKARQRLGHRDNRKTGTQKHLDEKNT